MDRPARLVDQGSFLLAFDEPEPLRISLQVLREYLAVVTRPLIWLVPISREIALDNVEQWVGTYGDIGRRSRGNGRASIAVP